MLKISLETETRKNKVIGTQVELDSEETFRQTCEDTYVGVKRERECEERDREEERLRCT